MSKRLITVMGMDAGYRKLGLSVFKSTLEFDDLLEAATVENPPGKTNDYVMQEDILGCWKLAGGLDQLLRKYTPDAVFIEMPHGGGQGARAHRCMGMVTGVMTSVFYAHQSIYFKMFSPREVEEALGIVVKAEKGKERKGSKGDRRAEKKKRIQDVVLASYPKFAKWPKQKRLFEDAADSVAAVMTARIGGEIERLLQKEHK